MTTKQIPIWIDCDTGTDDSVAIMLAHALPELSAFADRLERATIDTIESGVMTKDLYLLSTLPEKRAVNSMEFLDAIAERLS